MKMPSILLVFLLLFFTEVISGQQKLNLGFEKTSIEGASRPWGWSSFYFGNSAHSEMDSLQARNGQYALKVSNEGKEIYSISHWIAPRMLRGKEVKLSAWTKVLTEDCNAWISAITWGDLDTLGFAQSQKAGYSLDWTNLETNIKIDSAAYSLVIELFSSGKGEVLFDDISIEIDGEKLDGVPVANDFTKKELALLEKHSHPFNQVKITSSDTPESFNDLQRFGEMVKGARIIGLGESTHGTSEFFSMKHRLLVYAVKHLKTRIFAFEDNQLQVEKINNYVLRGEGESDQLIKNLFGVWNTEEVLDLINWVRIYNIKNPQDPVEFVGFDAQNPLLPIEHISKTLSRVSPELKIEIDSLYQNFQKAWQQGNYPMSDFETMKSWYDDATKAYELISTNSKEWTRKSVDKDQVIWLLQNARSVKNAASSYSGDITVRDKYMAENLIWIADQKQSKGPIIVWAHDVHVNHGHGPDDIYNYFGGASMGAHLRKEYGEAYKAFGFFTYEGEYATYLYGKPIEAAAHPAPKGSIDEALHRIGLKEKQKNYILDLRWARKNPFDHFWILEPRPVRFATYFPADYGYETMVSLPFQFDGIIFIDKTSAAKKLK